MEETTIAYNVRFFINTLPLLFAGVKITIELSLAASVLAALWALPIVFLRISDNGFARRLGTSYVEFLRNTPLLVQLYFVYFGLPYLGVRLTPFYTALLGIVLQHGAFFSEIYRAGIESVGAQSRDAAKGLGMSYWQAMRFVILPQAIKKIIPASSNEFVQIVKDSSLGSTIAVAELTAQSLSIAEQSAQTSIVFLATALYYLVIISFVILVLRLVEARLNYAE